MNTMIKVIITDATAFDSTYLINTNSEIEIEIDGDIREITYCKIFASAIHRAVKEHSKVYPYKRGTAQYGSSITNIQAQVAHGKYLEVGNLKETKASKE